jgi:GNAT superfamily N-acetyltransferase
VIRKATDKDIASIAAIYDLVLKQEESGLVTIGWQRDVYPTEDTARQAVLRDDMFVYENDNTHSISAAAIINHIQVPSYANGNWSIEADGDEVLVLHTLVVNPQDAGKGIGTAFVDFYEQTAKEKGCKTLRMDTQVKNAAARKLYHKLGYTEIGIVPCDFNGIEDIQLVLLEKGLK